ncbi:MAG: hypothetical protein SVP26_07410 [Chloroflexota bacterium]|nr:hypothetical protein [Chloroflexota bacterium]
MAELADHMPPLTIPSGELRKWGSLWLGDRNPEKGTSKDKQCFDRYQSVNFALFIDNQVGRCVAEMLGGIPIKPAASGLIPPMADCVEVGNARVIGGVRPQSFDVVYRPDGPRIVFDSKTLNDIKSVGKNWQNMINDLATEATTVHTRFPHAIVAFIVLIPRPCLAQKQLADMTRTLERLGAREDVLDQAHLAEAISLVVWDPETGEIDRSMPPEDSPLRVERFSDTVYPRYVGRYKGLPPHD